MPHKAQTEVITIVLLTGIVISLVGTAYMWGMPLISKRTSITDFLSAEDFLIKLDSKIVEIANSGSGQATLAIPKGRLKIIPYYDASPGNNSIVLEVIVDQPLVLSNSVILKTSVLGEVATYGEGEPRVINLTSQNAAGKNKLIFNLHYRELDTRTQPAKGYIIRLKSGTVSGTSQVMVSYAGTDSSGTAKNGGPLVASMIRIDIV